MKRKLLAVIRHEYLTIVKQPAFILTLLAVPLLVLAVGGISHFADRTATASIEEAAEQVGNVVVIDNSGLINADIAATFDLELRSAEETRSIIETVKQEELAGALIYPADLAETRRFEIHLSGGDDFAVSSAVSELGERLLRASLLAPIGDETIAALLMEGASGQITAYENGEMTAGIAGYIVPGVFMVIFFIILFFSMGYMLLGVAEEKENRSMEMVLSYLKPRTLITGKLFGVSLVALTQLLFFMILAAGVLVAARQFDGRVFGMVAIDFDLSGLVFDPVAIIVGLSVLVLGFLLFAALMSGVASMAPGVKEANSFSGIFFLLPFVPFWSFGVISTAPESGLVKFLSFFPLTSPTTLLLRNTLGNIDMAEAVMAVAVLVAFTVLFFLLAAKLFRLGALEYTDRIRFSSIFRK